MGNLCTIVNWLLWPIRLLINHADVIIALLAFILSIYTILKSRKDTKYNNFIKAVEQYSTKDMHQAIKSLCDFARDHKCYIYSDDTDIVKKDKLIILVNKYLECINSSNNDNNLDAYRRKIINYFMNIKVFVESGLLDVNLAKRYWSEEALDYLINIVIPIEYIALPIHNKKTLHVCEIIEFINDLDYKLPNEISLLQKEYGVIIS